MAEPQKTLFQKIADKEIPAKLVYEDDRAVAFHDINPQAPTHVLVVPREPIVKLSDAGPQHEALLGHLLLVANHIAREQGLESYRVVINCGEKAGQSVWHLHLHLLGGRPMHWPPG